MKSLLIVGLLMLAGTVGAQTANVVELSPRDAANVSKAYYNLKEATAKWESAVRYVEQTYIPKGRPNNCKKYANKCVSEEWSYGVQFSNNFKFIVPSDMYWYRKAYGYSSSPN